jgi:hypothetical protein
MRTLTAEHAALAARKFTAPLYLVELDLASGVRRFTTRGRSVTWQGDVFDRLCQVGPFEEVEGGGQRATIRLDDSDGALRPDFLVADPRRRSATVWEGHGTELVTRLTGVIGAVRREGGWVIANLYSTGNRGLEVRIGPPLITHLTAPGTIVQIGGETVVLEGR